MKTFGDYEAEKDKWITTQPGEFYPDNLDLACDLYGPMIEDFGTLLTASTSSQDLFRRICRLTDTAKRIQLCRVFRKYVSPATSVEMLKKKSLVDSICANYGDDFRDIDEVRTAFTSRPVPDEALAAVLWEYKDRGKKGYELTEVFFGMVNDLLPGVDILGPLRAGKDIPIGDYFPDYPHKQHPLDFVLLDKATKEVLAIGFARYDGDRGGSQEDDRTGGNKHIAAEFQAYAEPKGLRTKVVYINDGPGLTLGSMWRDYAALESSWPGHIVIATLKMVPVRLTEAWLRS